MWISVYTVAITILVTVTAVISMTQQRRQRNVDYLMSQVQLDADQQRQAVKLHHDIDHYSTVVARYQRLAWPVTIGEVISLIGDETPTNITLTSISVTPRARSGQTQRRRQPAAGIDYAVMYVEIAGIAPGDMDVASFVSGLQDRPLFSSIVVDYVRKAKMGEYSAREFGLTCEINLKTRYVRVDEEETP